MARNWRMAQGRARSAMVSAPATVMATAAPSGARFTRHVEVRDNHCDVGEETVRVVRKGRGRRDVEEVYTVATALVSEAGKDLVTLPDRDITLATCATVEGAGIALLVEFGTPGGAGGAGGGGGGGGGMGGMAPVAG